MSLQKSSNRYLPGTASRTVLLAALAAARVAAQTDNFEPISEEAFRQNAAQVFWMAFAVVAASALFVIGLRWYYSWRVEKLRSHLGRLYQISEHVLVAVDPGDIEQLVVDSAREISDATPLLPAAGSRPPNVLRRRKRRSTRRDLQP